jgi:hypothetical protein
VISNVSRGLVNYQWTSANTTKSGFSNGSRTIAPSIIAQRLPTTTMTETAQTINASISNANAFLIGCSVARMGLWTSQTF